MLASIKNDTSRITAKIGVLSEMLTEHVSDKLVGVISGLADNVILVDCTSAVSAGGSLDIVCVFDFDRAAYDKVMSAARALKIDGVTH